MQPTGSGRSRYELREVLGRGGMGVIYRAWDSLMGREVALKTILDVQSQQAQQMFYREWGLQASITHPNIVEIYDIGEMMHEGAVRPYFVMPLLPGATLSDLIRNSSPRLNLERTVDMIGQVCRGLQAAHDRGLIHRDLKPSNIFILDDDTVKIIDFGIAHAGTSAQTSVRGTLAYMAPEVLLMQPASVASDIFALGVLSYEAFTGRRPFEGASDADVARSILHDHPPALCDLAPAVPLNVGRAIHKAMAKQPWHRYGSAREMGEILAHAARGEAIEIFDQAKVKPRVERASRAFEQGEYAMATEILSELESEGHVEQEIVLLRRQVEKAQRQVTVKQFLESARRFNEEEEFGLALRKVQEALDLDADNVDAQALKNEIEKRRRARKIEEWAQLARKHLDNNAFAHARNAVQSLLELRPNEPGAMAMLEEIQRKEQEYERVRQEKSRLHTNARGAWERGEVTTALTQLEKWMALDREAPETQSERLLSLQNFYNQVRTEHESLKKSYDQARQLLAEGNYAESLAICRQYLSKYPGHALFQALKFDVEEKRRQHLSAFVAETDVRVENEPDLDRRVAILEEALTQHPDEQHFQRALKLARDKRDLVASVVSRARLHEDEGRFSEALDQWEILRAVHAGYPGLDYEVERVTKRRDAQARQEARSDWVVRVDRQMDAHEFEKAAAAAQQALAEFPGDAELEELVQIARHRHERCQQAMTLLDKGRAEMEAGLHEKSVATLREAEQLDEGNPTIRTALAAALAAQASRLADSDPRKADTVVSELLEIDPGHTVGINLRALREDKKREEFVTWCTAQARKLQASGDVSGASAIVQQGLASYPNDNRLLQLQAQLDRVLEEAQRKQDRKRKLEEMREIVTASAAATNATAAERLLRTAEVTAASYTGDDEFQRALGEVRQNAARVTAAARSAHPASGVTLPPPPSGIAPPRPASGMTPPPPPPSGIAPPRPASGITPPAPPAAAARAAARGLTNWMRYALLGGAVLILAVGVFTIWKATRSSAPATVKVEIRTTPPNARIFIGDQERGVSNLTVDLAPGEYQVTAQLEGHQPAITSFTVQAGRPVTIDMPLAPWKSAVRLSSDVQLSEVSLAGRPLNPGAAGDYSLDGLEDGDYLLKAAGPGGSVEAGLQLSGRSVPILSQPIQAKGLDLALVQQFADQMVFYSAQAGATAALDGGEARPVPPEGLSFPRVQAGAHQVTLTQGMLTRTLPVTTSGGAPVVQAFIFGATQAGQGSILVVTGEDQASLAINGYPHWRKTVAGSMRIGSLKPGVYRITVSKEGFDSPPPQQVEVKAGEEIRIEMPLKAVVRLASVRLQGPPGAQVWVDGSARGSIDPDGNFRLDLPPGSHTFELRRGAARSTSLSRDLKAGETMSIGGELAFAALPGTVRFNVTPPDAVITIRRRGEPESAARPVTQNPASLPEGNYTITASAPGHAESVVNVLLSAGGTLTVPLSLRPLASSEEPAKPTVITRGIRDFEDYADWSSEGDWSVRRGGGTTLYRAQPGAGTYSFTVRLTRGKRLQWYVDYVDSRNHAQIRIEKNDYIRTLVRNGKTAEEKKVPHRLANPNEVRARIVVAPASIRIDFWRDGQWAAMDQWSEPGADLSAGRFGFLVPGGKLFLGADEIRVRDFSFRPGEGGR
jgi:cytochrome c-type biogenesis protein CcmH/NrfG